MQPNDISKSSISLWFRSDRVFASTRVLDWVVKLFYVVLRFFGPAVGTAIFTLISIANLAAQSGPAGIGSDSGQPSLLYWIDANVGRTGVNPVTALADLSGNGVANQLHGTIDFVPAVLNGFGVLRFDGVGSEIETNVSINADAYPELTVIAVYIPHVPLSGSVWGEDNGEWDRFLTDINLVPTLNASVGAGYDPGSPSHPCNHIDQLFSVGNATITSVIYRDDLYNGTAVRVNAHPASAFTSNAADYQSTGYSSLYVGAIGSNGFRFDGDIAELIVYGSALNEAEILILENYLSAKYNIALVDSPTDLYDEDDDGYDFDVAGIGRLNALNLHDDSQGTGIVRISNATNLDDNEFFFWGHDGGLLMAGNLSDVPSGVEARSNRIWRVSDADASGVGVDIGSIDLSFDLGGLGSLNANDLRLLVDTDNDGIFSDEVPISGAVHAGGNIYLFQAVSALANNLRFTFGTANVNLSPLPVEISYFGARELPDGQLVLEWNTESELNCERFDIMRSIDGKTWEKVGSQMGQGTSSRPMEYQWNDGAPCAGVSYYRLEEVDFDGQRQFSEIVKLDRKFIFNPYGYPNPSASKLFVNNAGELVRIVDLVGQDVTALVPIVAGLPGKLTLDVSSLPTGRYFVITTKGQFVFQKAD